MGRRTRTAGRVATQAAWWGAWLVVVVSFVQAQEMETVRVAQALRPGRFEILPPERLEVDQDALIEWRDADGGRVISEHLASLTWYYTDGRSVRRVCGYFWDEFRRDLLHWDAGEDFGLNWLTMPDAWVGRDARVCRGQRGAPPLVSLDGYPGGVVISARLKPLVGAAGYGVAARVERRGQAYYALRNAAELVSTTVNEPLRAAVVPQVSPLSWYWYELGVQENRHNTLLRARIYSADRSRVLRTLSHRLPHDDRDRPRGGLVALLGNGEFSEVYVDPWSARWEDDSENRFRWNTADVPDGVYRLVVELANDRQPTQRYLSGFQITVRH